ncbi:MAG: AAA family ATPase [Desulfobacterales bacterium]|nr:AAA family ATPase [Desulfobacterales bacterium]
MEPRPVVIAVCGKGGVGKTSLSALIVRSLTRDPARRVLAVDADPAVGLAYALGMPVVKTVDQIRQELIQTLGEAPSADKEELLRRLDYDLFAALSERDNLAFLAIGRPEGHGCFCQVNQLLRQLIGDLAGRFDAVVIDGEAGLEQIQRRVMDLVTHLLVASDGSLKSRRVAATLHHMARELPDLQAAGVLFNKLAPVEETEILAANPLPLIHVLHEIPAIRDFDRRGRSFFDLPWSAEMAKLEDAVLRFLNPRP